MSDRRDFLVSLGAPVAVVGLGASSPAAALLDLAAGEAPAANRFARHLHGRFAFSGVQNARAADAELVEIVHRSVDPRLEQYELVFSAPSGGELSEGVYWMTTPAGERSAHLVQPLAGRGADRRFTVHFSLLV